MNLASLKLHAVKHEHGVVNVEDSRCVAASIPSRNMDMARLFAAGPDLLKALQEMLSAFQDHEQYDEDSAEVIKMARAAINKATT